MGIELFKSTTFIRLTQQHRAEDADHTQLLNKMSDGERITPTDLESYKTLSKKDIKDDPEWNFATILVSGNRERHEFNMSQSKKWASYFNTHAVHW